MDSLMQAASQPSIQRDDTFIKYRIAEFTNIEYSMVSSNMIAYIRDGWNHIYMDLINPYITIDELRKKYGAYIDMITSSRDFK